MDKILSHITITELDRTMDFFFYPVLVVVVVEEMIN